MSIDGNDIFYDAVEQQEEYLKQDRKFKDLCVRSMCS